MASTAQSLSGTVLDNKTRKPLEFCSVGIIGKNIGTITDEAGRFALDLKGVNGRDSLRISYLGYEKLTLEYPKFKSGNLGEILLESKHVILPVIEITDMRSRLQVGSVGNARAKGFNGWGGIENAGKGKQVGLLVDIDNEILLTSLAMLVEKNTYDSVLLRLNLYSLTEQNLPDRELLQQNIFFQIKKSHGWVKIDLEKYKVSLQEDFYLGVEWIAGWGGKSQGDLLTFSRVRNKPGISIYRSSPQGEWSKQESSAALAMIAEGIKIDTLVNSKRLAHSAPLLESDSTRQAKRMLPTTKNAIITGSPSYHVSGKKLTLGQTKAGKSSDGMSGIINGPSDEVGVLITGVTRPYSLVDFNFHLRFNTFDSLLFELRFYDATNEDQPAQLFDGGVQFKIGKSEGWQKVNLEKQKIVLTKETVVTLQLLGGISLDNKPRDLYFSKSTGEGFHRDITTGDWTSNPNSARTFFITVRE